MRPLALKAVVMETGMQHATLALILMLAGPQGIRAETGETRRFEVSGRVMNARFANVSLHSAYTPWSATTYTDQTGGFKFKHVPQGKYTLAAWGRRGEAVQTVNVTPRAAENKSRDRIRLKVVLKGDSVHTLMRRNTVSVRQLSIPQKAFKEYAEAEKRLQKDDFAGATEKLKRAVELGPGFLSAWSKLARIASYEQDYAGAEQYLRSGLEQDASSLDLRSKLGQALTAQGKTKEAIEEGTAVLKLRPQDPIAHAQIGINLLTQGDADGALQHLSEARRLAPDMLPAPQILLARIFMKRGQAERAATEIRDYIGRHPHAPDADELRDWLKRQESRPGEAAPAQP